MKVQVGGRAAPIRARRMAFDAFGVGDRRHVLGEGRCVEARAGFVFAAADENQRTGERSCDEERGDGPVPTDEHGPRLKDVHRNPNRIRPLWSALTPSDAPV